MKKILVILTVLLLVGCQNEVSYQKLEQDKAYEQLNDEEIILLDVREVHEFDSGHIKGAILLPLGDIGSKSEEVLPDKEAKIFVYCRSGNRSKTAVLDLIEQGYTNVYDIGGIIDWEYEIEK